LLRYQRTKWCQYTSRGYWRWNQSSQRPEMRKARGCCWYWAFCICCCCNESRHVLQVAQQNWQPPAVVACLHDVMLPAAALHGLSDDIAAVVGSRM
jgi:hypothetical protein